MPRRLLIEAIFTAGALVAQAPPQAPSPTFGWTKASLYMAESTTRPFRIFLDPEMDFSPYGSYLPEWRQLYPAEGVTWESNKQQPKFLIQSNQVWVKGDQVSFFVVREIHGANPPYEQWGGTYGLKAGTLMAMRWGAFDGRGEPIEFRDYLAMGGIALDARAPGWKEVQEYLKGEPAREEEQRKLILKLMYGPGGRPPDAVDPKK